MGKILRILGIEGEPMDERAAHEAIALIRLEGGNEVLTAEIRRRIKEIHGMLSRNPRAAQDIINQVRALEENLGMAMGRATQERRDITSALSNLRNIENAINARSKK